MQESERKKSPRAPDWDKYLNDENYHDFVTYAKGAKMYSLNYWTFVRLAKEAGASWPLRKTAVVDLLVLDEYMENNKREADWAGKGRLMASRKNIDDMNEAVDVNAYAELIRENLEIDFLIANNPFDAEMLQGIYELVLETVVCQRDTIVIEGTSYPMSIVKSKFMKLNSSHVEYVMDSLKCTTSKIRNIKKYLLACLFNAPTTMSSCYQQAVNHDFPQYAKAR